MLTLQNVTRLTYIQAFTWAALIVFAPDKFAEYQGLSPKNGVYDPGFHALLQGRLVSYIALGSVMVAVAQ